MPAGIGDKKFFDCQSREEDTVTYVCSFFLFFFFQKMSVFSVHSGFGCWGLVVGIIFSLHVLCVLALIIANAPPGHISFVSMLLMVSVMIIVIFLLLTGWDTPISHTVYPYLFRSSI